MASEVFVRKMSDHMEFGVVLGWLVNEGDQVEKDQPLLEIETDKAAVELVSPASGIIRGIRPGVEAGAKVPIGETIAFIAEPGETVPSLPPFAPNIAEAAREETASHVLSAEVDKLEGNRKIRAAPAVRRLAKDLGIDINHIKGTGPAGRITKRDVEEYVKRQKEASRDTTRPTSFSPVAQRMAKDLGIELENIQGTGPEGRVTKEDVRSYYATTATQTPVEHPQYDTLEWLELSQSQRITGERMVESIRSVPQFALNIRADMTNTLQMRQALMASIQRDSDAQLSITAMLVMIIAESLRRFPRANVSFVEGRLKRHKQINIGVAMGSEKGLIVPVIKDANEKSLVQISQELLAFREKADRSKFELDDLSGGTFTISNLGMYGIEQFTAIVNPPESAILAVGRIINTPTGMLDNTVALRPMMSLTLSVDHRSMDGVQGARLLGTIKNLLEHPYLLFQDEILGKG